MSVLVTGSLAYDHIMVFHDEFRNHILPEKVHMLNVGFNIEDLAIEFGGTAGNVAYNLALLEQSPIILATAGKDFERYWQRIASWGLSLEYIKVLEQVYTAQAFVTTDLKDNQITAFYGGATFRAHEQPLSSYTGEVSCVLIAPNGPQAMQEHAQYAREQGWKFWFDPGQAMNAFTGEQLLQTLEGAQGLMVNDYEWELFRQKTEKNAADILTFVPSVLVTMGERGVNIVQREAEMMIPAVANVKAVDPTGAGDAFRAGLLYGLQLDCDLAEACEYGGAVASFAVECKGTQNHRFTLAQIEERRSYLHQ
jgi:adenosine kinase